MCTEAYPLNTFLTREGRDDVLSKVANENSYIWHSLDWRIEDLIALLYYSIMQCMGTLDDKCINFIESTKAVVYPKEN